MKSGGEGVANGAISRMLRRNGLRFADGFEANGFGEGEALFGG